MKIEGSVAVVTGANRGLGRALVEQLLQAGAQRVYAAARDTARLAEAEQRGAGRVIPVALDLHNPAGIAAAAKAARDATLLINNAGALEMGSQLTVDEDSIRRQFETNYFGTLRVVRAFAPTLRVFGGAIVNVLSVASFASVPLAGGYSASKAALHSLTLALRAELGPQGVAVHGVYPGPLATDMANGGGPEAASAADVAAAILAGIEAGDAYIFPDRMSAQVYADWKSNHTVVEAWFGSM